MWSTIVTKINYEINLDWVAFSIKNFFLSPIIKPLNLAFNGKFLWKKPHFSITDNLFILWLNWNWNISQILYISCIIALNRLFCCSNCFHFLIHFTMISANQNSGLSFNLIFLLGNRNIIQRIHFYMYSVDSPSSHEFFYQSNDPNWCTVFKYSF